MTKRRSLWALRFSSSKISTACPSNYYCFQLPQPRGNPSFFPLPSPPTYFIRKVSVSKCRKDSFKVSRGRLSCLSSTWKQFLWPGNSLNAT